MGELSKKDIKKRVKGMLILQELKAAASVANPSSDPKVIVKLIKKTLKLSYHTLGKDKAYEHIDTLTKENQAAKKFFYNFLDAYHNKQKAKKDGKKKKK